jgi:hypothetical protein
LGGFEMGDPKVTIGFNTKWSGFEWFCDTLSLGTSIYDWLVLWNILYFSIFWEQYPIWLIFFRGIETTNQWIYIYMTGLYTTHRIDTRMPWLTLRRKNVVSKLWRWIHATGRCEAIQQPNLGTRPYSLPIFNYRYLISKCIKHIPSGELT